MLPNDFSPWLAIYQQMRRGLKAGCFEAIVHDLRSMLWVVQGRQAQPSSAVLDGRTLQSSCECGPRAGYDGHKCKKGSKVHRAVDTLGYLLAVHLTPANQQQRAQVQVLEPAVQQATAQTVKLAFAVQGYTAKQPGKPLSKKVFNCAWLSCPRPKRGCAVAAPMGGPTQLQMAGSLSTPCSPL